MSPSSRSILAYVVAAITCVGCTTDPPGDDAGLDRGGDGGSAAPDAGKPGESCEFLEESPGRQILSECVQRGARWSCICLVDAETYDPSTPPKTGGVADTSESCDRALELICELPEDQCRSIDRECVRTDADLFACTCGTVERTVEAPACHAAISRACSGAPQCSSYLGRCEDDADRTGVDCTCVDGTQRHAAYDEDTVRCEDALERACADADVPEEARCTAASGVHEARCEWEEPEAGARYECTCVDHGASGGSVGGVGSPFDAESCQDALAQSCPQAVDAASGAP